MSATTTTGITINLTGSRHEAAGVATWWTKREALTALAALRASGRNCDQDIEVHRAETRMRRGFWVIGRPDHYNGFTHLMTANGQWVRGRLHDATPCFCEKPCRGGHSAPWVRLAGDLLPPTFTHVTRTVPYHSRIERYKTKSNGSCGRYVRSDDSVALCTCGWSRHEDSRPEAQAAARAHRAEVAA